jgi:hypothetical protein
MEGEFFGFCKTKQFFLSRSKGDSTYPFSKFVQFDKLYFNKSTYKWNVVAHNIEWEGCLTHIVIYDVKTTLHSMGGWLASCGDFQLAVGGSFSWIWMHLQNFIW